MPAVCLPVRRTLQATAGLLAFFAAVRGLAAWHGQPAEALYDGELEAQAGLARGVDRWLDEDLSREDFDTGSGRYDGEWLFAVRMMAVLGYAQTALEHPELTDDHSERIDRALDALVSKDSRAFDREAWGSDPLDDLGTDRPHVAYLGYLALALSLARLVDPHTRHAALEERVIAHLARCFERSDIGLLRTYPGEIYPIDNTSFFGALAVHDRATGEDHGALLHHLLSQLDARYRDPQSGLLYQSVDPDDGAPLDRPRGSGTALAAYYVSFADPTLSRSLYRAMRRCLIGDTFGFGTTREYLEGEGGLGDVDSGPVIFGQGVSATGFTLALARVHGDRATYVSTYATASMFGGPIDDEGTHYALGGPMGDALLFALSTALPAERWAAVGRAPR